MAGWAAGDNCRQAILRSEDDDRHFMTLSFPRKREPRGGVSLRTLWIPAFAGMTKVGGPRTGIPTLHGSQRKRGPERSPFDPAMAVLRVRPRSARRGPIGSASCRERVWQDG